MKFIAIIQHIQGFLSKMCLIDPDFPVGSSAPKKFILKVHIVICSQFFQICTQITMVEATEKMKDKVPEDSPFSDLKMMELMSSSVKKVFCHLQTS